MWPSTLVSLVSFLAVFLLAREAACDPWNDSGFQLRIGGGGSFWVGREMDMNFSHGGQVNVHAGYRLNGWIALDGGGEFALMSREDEDINLAEQMHSWFAAHVGARAYLLGRRRPVDVFVGLHLGYVQAFRRRYDNSAYGYLHGVSFSESVGFEVHVDSVWSLGIDFAVVNPLWLQRCSEAEDSARMCFEYGETEESDDWEEGPLMLNLGLYASAVIG